MPKYVIHRIDMQGWTQRKQMIGWSGKGRRKVADLLGICRKCSQIFHSSEQTVGRSGRNKGVSSFFRVPLLLQKSETPTKTFALHGKGAADLFYSMFASLWDSLLCLPPTQALVNWNDISDYSKHINVEDFPVQISSLTYEMGFPGDIPLSICYIVLKQH